MKRKFEVRDDPIDNLVILDKGDHFHLSAALRTEERGSISGGFCGSFLAICGDESTLRLTGLLYLW